MVTKMFLVLSRQFAHWHIRSNVAVQDLAIKLTFIIFINPLHKPYLGKKKILFITLLLLFYFLMKLSCKWVCFCDKNSYLFRYYLKHNFEVYKNDNYRQNVRTSLIEL